jgi:hypothetical protein
VADASGTPIDVAGNGLPGSDYVRIFGPEVLAGADTPSGPRPFSRAVQSRLAAAAARRLAIERQEARVIAAARLHARAVGAVLAARR